MERFRHLLVTTAGQIRLACKESSNPDLADCVQEHPILALHSGCQCCVQGMCEFRRCLNPDLKTQTLFCPFCPMSVSPTPPDHPNPHQSTAYTMAPSHSRCYESTGPGPSGRTSSSLTGIKDRSRGRHPSPCHHRPVQRSLTRRGQVDATKLPKNQSGTSDGRPQFSHHQDSSPNHRPSLHCRGRLRREHRSRDRVGPSQHVQTSSACSGQYSARLAAFIQGRLDHCSFIVVEKESLDSNMDSNMDMDVDPLAGRPLRSHVEDNEPCVSILTLAPIAGGAN